MGVVWCGVVVGHLNGPEVGGPRSRKQFDDREGRGAHTPLTGEWELGIGHEMEYDRGKSGWGRGGTTILLGRGRCILWFQNTLSTFCFSVTGLLDWVAFAASR